MMTGNKGGGDIELRNIMPGETVIIPRRRTSQVGATHLMVSLTPAEALTHLLPGHAGVGAGVVGLLTNVLAVLVWVITSRPHRGVTGRGDGQLLTFTAAYSTMIIWVSGAGLPRLEATVHIIDVGPEPVSVRSVTVTPVIPLNALIPAHHTPPTLSVVARVRVGRAVIRPHSPQHQQQDYRGQDPHTRH